MYNTVYIKGGFLKRVSNQLINNKLKFSNIGLYSYKILLSREKSIQFEHFANILKHRSSSLEGKNSIKMATTTQPS